MTQSISGTIGGVARAILVGTDSSNNLFPAGLAVDATGNPIGTASNPLIVAELPYQGVVTMTVGSTVTAGRALRVICTAAGNVSLTYADGSTDVVPVSVGLTYLPGAIVRVNSAGTTATGAYAVLK